MTGEVRVDTRELDAALANVTRAVKDLSAVNLAAAEALLPAVAQRTPVRTGNLAASWTASTTGDGGGGIDNAEEYAGVIEYGDARRGIEGAHMVADAVAASDRELLATYEEELAKVMRRAGFEVKS